MNQRMPSTRSGENPGKGEGKMLLEHNNHSPLTGFLHKPQNLITWLLLIVNNHYAY